MTRIIVPPVTGEINSRLPAAMVTLAAALPAIPAEARNAVEDFPGKLPARAAGGDT